MNEADYEKEVGRYPERKTMQPLEYVAMQCDCKSERHQIRFCFDPEDGDLYLSVQLARWNGFFKRCWLALRYVFNMCDADSGRWDNHWDSTLLNESAEPLRRLLERRAKRLIELKREGKVAGGWLS